MRKRHFVLLTLVNLIPCFHVLAQVNSFCQAHADTLYCKIPSLFGNAAVNPLEPLDQALATQLTLVPLASPASGIVYIKNPATKLPVPSGTETFGPVLTERGETLYKGKLFVAATYQRFRFDSLDGINLKQIPMIFEFCTPAGQCGPIATIVRTDAHLDQYALFATYGVTDWLDASIAVPILNVTVSASGVSCIQPYCSFTPSGGGSVSFQNETVAGSATGVGDVVLRAKASVFEAKKFKLAFGVDVRLPSGDELNFLGAGSVGVKPFEAVSRSGKVSPHANFAYQWNGDSLLAGIVPGEKGKLPEVISYAVGADVAALKNLTLSADYLGEHVFNASRLARTTALGLPNTTLAEGTFDTARGALGFKWRPMKDLLISGNILGKFDHNGLHHTAVPLVGISYTFNLRKQSG
jgi:Putative MetA-pathway of phenol degradation